MKKILAFVLLLGIMFVPLEAYAKDVYIGKTIGTKYNRQVQANCYYDDTTIKGSKSSGKVSVNYAVYSNETGEFLFGGLLTFKRNNGNWYVASGNNEFEELDAQPSYSAKWLVFNAL